MLTRRRQTRRAAAAMIRFRCEHCHSRLVMHGRHLQELVTCHECGRATHPVAKRLDAERNGPPICENCGQVIGKLQARHEWRGQCVCKPCFGKLSLESPATTTDTGLAFTPAVRPQAPTTRIIPVGFELTAGPLAPLLLVGAAAGAFFAALSVMSSVGGFATALLLIASAAVGLRWLRRGTDSIRGRLDQIEAVRLRYGSVRVIAMLLAYFWSQPARRKPWAGILMLFWMSLYMPYLLSATLFWWPRTRALAIRV